MKKILLLITLIICGCSTNKPLIRDYPKDSHYYVIPETKVIVAPYDTLNEEFTRVSGYDFKVNGFYNTKNEELWVMENSIRDVNGEVMPNSFVLGHEIWHTVKPDFHKGDPNNYMLPELPGLTIMLNDGLVD